MDMGTEAHSFNCLTEIEEAIQLSDEDFLNIEDLSEFSDEDIAAPIIGSSSSSLVSMTQNKGNLTPSTTEDSISKSSCTVAPITAIAATHTQDCRTSEAIRSKNAGLLPGHEDPGFDWLSSFSEETALIYGASSFGVEFLDNCDSTAFEYAAIGSTQHERYNGVAKIFIGDAAHEKLGSNESGRTISTHSHSYCGNMGRLSCKERDTSLPNTNLLPLPAKARSKRPRSATKAWTSAMLWGNASSPTESLESGLSYLKPDMCTLSSLHMSNGMCKDDFKVDVPISLKEGLSYGGDELYSYPFDDKRCRKVGKHAKAPKKRFVEHAGHGQDAVVAYDDDEEYNGDEHTEGALSQKEAPTRRCTHCLSNKTPQWRAGPLGPKTLCNACGVRYKSGRLFDEYRPAKSPTFLSFKHSNSHKKVIEMRRRKGLDASPSINQAYKRYQNSQCPKSSHNGSISSTSSASTMAPLLPSPSPSSSSSSSMKLNIKLSPSTKSQANPAEVTLITTPDVNFFY